MADLRAEPRSATRNVLARVGAIVRRIIGVPDYDAYVAHVRVHHPGTIPLSRGEFERRRLDERYSKPGGRCC